MYLPHVVVDYSTARNVLEHEIRECKIKLIRRNDGQIYAVVLVDDGVAARSECLSSQSDHLSANVHAVNFAKDACQRLCDPASATPYLKDFHSSGISTLADVHHVVEDVAFHRLFTGRKKLRRRSTPGAVGDPSRCLTVQIEVEGEAECVRNKSTPQHAARRRRVADMIYYPPGQPERLRHSKLKA